MSEGPVRVIGLSDTHGVPPRDLPPGEVLVHAGDLTAGGSLEELAAVCAWLAGLPHPHKVVIAGNHDACFAQHPRLARAMLRGVARYLEGEAATVAGLRLWGGPWTPRYGPWWFMEERGAPLAARWARIPEKLDLLLTHGPAYRRLDRTWTGHPAGDLELSAALRRARPRVHLFGHIHEAIGALVADDILSLNAATGGQRTAHPAVLDLWPGERAELLEAPGKG